MASQGANPVGIDTNKDMVERALEKGLDVSTGEAIRFLKETEAKFDIISAFHLIEHLDTSDWGLLIKLAFDSLEDGGILILETPNPENFAVSSFGFYMDPTHIRPIPPDLLAFQVEQSGFSQHRLLRLNGISREPKSLSEAMFSIGPDIGIIAQKYTTGGSLDFSITAGAGISPANAISIVESKKEFELGTKITELEATVTEMDSKVLEVIRDNEQSKAELEIAQKETDALRQSWSWRITKPIRIIASLFSSRRNN